jgi:choline dehydrogenase
MSRKILLALVALAAGCGPTGSPADGYDVIVVGSGAGGGPLAARLARSGLSVLLIEAGRDVGGKLEYQVPAMHALATEDSDMAWWFFVDQHADPAIDQADSKITPEGILYPRGSALGGSTAVNAMVTVLPSPSDWNRLSETTGEPGYRAVAMDGYYDRVREWLPISAADPELAAGDAALTGHLLAAAEEISGQEIDLPSESGAEAAAEVARLLAGDLNAALRGSEATGLFRLPTATEDGSRRGTRELILDTVEAGYPLTVLTEAFVTRVVWDRSGEVPVAAGVELVRGRSLYGASLGPRGAPSAPEVIHAGEVVLSAGVFNSPQILMLSGVGDPDELAALGIDSVVASPGVGRNLQDRYEASVVTELGAPVSLTADCDLGGDPATDPCVEEWRAGEGVYRTNGFLATALIRSRPSEPLADLQVFAFPASSRGYYPGYSRDATVEKNRLSWLILKAHTENRDGRVRLASTDPFTRPTIEKSSFDEAAPLEDRDLLAVVEGVKFVRRVIDRAGQADEIWPGEAVASDAELAAFVRKEAWGHHACCTNRMGRAGDPEAVVDPGFRVIGARGLRVVDASVFPDIPGTFIALPIFMMSEKAADQMIEAAR